MEKRFEINEILLWIQYRSRPRARVLAQARNDSIKIDASFCVCSFIYVFVYISVERCWRLASVIRIVCPFRTGYWILSVYTYTHTHINRMRDKHTNTINATERDTYTHQVSVQRLVLSCCLYNVPSTRNDSHQCSAVLLNSKRRFSINIY